MTSSVTLRQRHRQTLPPISGTTPLAPGIRTLWATARAPLSAMIPIAAVVQGLVLLATASQLDIVATAVGDLVAILSQEERPALSEATPLAVTLAQSLAVVLGASALGWVISAVALSLAVRRTARRKVTIRRLRPIEVITSIGIVAAASITLAVLAAAVSAAFQDVVLTEVRGTTLTVVVPDSAFIAVVLTITSCIIVAGAVIVPTAFAVEVANLVQPSEPESPANSHSSKPTTRVSMQAMIGPAVGALVLAFGVIAALARPVSDDYRVMALVRENGFVEYLSQHLTTETGRFSQGATNWILARALGDLVNPGTAIFIFLLTAVSCGLAFRVFLPRLRETGRGTAWWLGTGFAVVSVFLVPSLVDSWLWFTSADVYMPGVAFALVGASMAKIAWDAQTRHGHAWVLPVAAVVIVIAQGFSEAASASIWIAASVFLVVGLRQRDRQRRLVTLIVWMSASVGLALIALAPAQSTRSGRIDSGNLIVGLLGGTYSGLPLWNQIGIDGWLLILGMGLALAFVIQSWISPRQLIVMASVGATLLVVVPLLGGSIAFLGLNWAPWRTLTIPGVAFAWGVTLLFASLLAPVLRRVLSSGRHRPQVMVRCAVALTLSIATVLTVPTLLAHIEAGTLRASLMAMRDASVTEQLADGSTKITVIPAPPLVYPTDSRDFEFLAIQNKDWFYPGFQDWFGIAPGDTLDYKTQQPAGYCVNDARVLLPSVLTCQGLGSAKTP